MVISKSQGTLLPHFKSFSSGNLLSFLCNSLAILKIPEFLQYSIIIIGGLSIPRFKSEIILPKRVYLVKIKFLTQVLENIGTLGYIIQRKDCLYGYKYTRRSIHNGRTLGSKFYTWQNSKFGSNQMMARALRDSISFFWLKMRFDRRR